MKTLSPSISAIVTVYNLQDCILETLDSLECQTHQDFELIIIDDGSTDNTFKLCKEFCAKSKLKTKLVQQKNQGVSAARNLGLQLAKGEYLLILDGDDVFDRTFVLSMFERAKETNADVICCRSSDYDNNTKQCNPIVDAINSKFLPISCTFSPSELKGTTCLTFIGWPWDKLYKKSLIEKFSLKFPMIGNSEDLVFVFQALCYADRISIVNKDLIKHRINRSSSLSNNREKDPMAFYEALSLLKSQLTKQPKVWERERWGFENWALQFSVWAISTLKDEQQKNKLRSNLKLGKLTAVGLYKHPAEYFSLSKHHLKFIGICLSEEDKPSVRKKNIFSRIKYFLKKIGLFRHSCG